MPRSARKQNDKYLCLCSNLVEVEDLMTWKEFNFFWKNGMSVFELSTINKTKRLDGFIYWKLHIKKNLENYVLKKFTLGYANFFTKCEESNITSILKY